MPDEQPIEPTLTTFSVTSRVCGMLAMLQNVLGCMYYVSTGGIHSALVKVSKRYAREPTRSSITTSTYGLDLMAPMP